MTPEQKANAQKVHEAYMRKAGLVIDYQTGSDLVAKADQLEARIKHDNGPEGLTRLASEFGKDEKELTELEEVISALGLRK